MYIFAQMNRLSSVWAHYGVHLLLFVATCVCTTIAGAEWSTNTHLLYGDHPMKWSHLLEGLHFSVPFLAVLTVHEFGHYVAARVYSIAVTLPYYIPLWLGFLGTPTIGTAGAFIRIKGRIRTRSEYFDVGVSGPLAGFCLAVIVLGYGFTHLPPQEHIFSLHPEYKAYGLAYAEEVYAEKGVYVFFGSTLLFDFFKDWIADPALLPHPYEMIHYPYLLAGYLSLFFTALNLLPIGQLDGGHLLYALVGAKWHGYISRVFLLFLIFYAGLGLMKPYLQDISFLWAGPLYLGFLYLCLRKCVRQNKGRWSAALAIFALQLGVGMLFPEVEGYSGWLLFGFLLGSVLGVDHPQALSSAPLSPTRRYVAYATLVVFIVCFSWNPFLIA